MSRTIANPWMLAAVGVVAAVMAPVLFGVAPGGGDPELMYQPIKSELVRALADGRLPFWSDRFGLGVPLVAESHVAAFYPLNWLLYRFLEVGTAYRLALWLHSVAIAAATFAYARVLGIGPAGAAIAAVGFSLCGFQAVHSVHEPFYHLMPLLPICLILTDRYATTGRPAWLAGLAIAWGTQLVLGHFQIQMWTAGLVLLTGGWRSTFGRAPGERARPLRIVGLMMGLGWGAAIAWVQLRLTWELIEESGFVRSADRLIGYSMPPGQWAQLAMPPVFLGLPRGQAEYWTHHGTTAGEACVYVGVVPLILAIVGWMAAPRDRGLAPWRLLAPLAFALATMPGWLPEGYLFLLRLPGLGLFRAPARYTMLTSLGLVLLAGRGLDLGRSASRGRFWGALAMAVAFGGLACWWSLVVVRGVEFQAAVGPGTVVGRFVVAAITWMLALSAIVGWRLRWVGAWAPLGVAAAELSLLFFLGPVEWGRVVRLPEESPALSRLAEAWQRQPGLVASRLQDVPVLAGMTVAFPVLGIAAPPPNYLLKSASLPLRSYDAIEARWQRRYGVSLGIWGAGDDIRGNPVFAVIDDPALDRVMTRVPKLNARGPWRLVHHPDAFPAARVARRVRVAARWGELHSELSIADCQDEAWFLAADGVPDLPDPPATTARVVSDDGRVTVVEHDGSCVLILRRTYYPGWTYRIDDGPNRPVRKVDGGLHGIPIPGAGTHRVAVAYRPTGLGRAASVSIGALGLAAIVLLAAGVGAYRGARRPGVAPSG